MLNLHNQKETAKSILKLLQDTYPSVVLAGGAPRDWYFNNTAKDLDIYFESKDNLEQLQFTLSQLGFIYTCSALVNPKDEYTLNPEIRYVLNCTYQGQQVQFMVCNTSIWDSVVQKFPFGICQVQMNSEGIFQYTEEFDLSVATKSLILLNSLYLDGDKYVQKIKERFIDYKYFNSKDEAWSYITSALMSIKETHGRIQSPQFL